MFGRTSPPNPWRAAWTPRFDPTTGTRIQTWTGSPVAMDALGATLPATIGALFQWDDANQQFDFWFRGFPGPFQTLTNGLVSGGTYFVQASGAATDVVPNGAQFVLPSGSAVPFALGVNGVLWGGATLPLDKLGTALPPEIAAVLGWNNATQGFDFWFRGFPIGFQTLSGGLHAWQFYFLQASAPGSLVTSIR